MENPNLSGVEITQKGEQKEQKRKWWQPKKKFKLAIEEDIHDFEKEFPEFKGWESIGFHRGLGRELWQIIIELFTTTLYIVLITYLMPILNPYPEIGGYQSIAGGIFFLIYRIFDLGTNFGLGRFIAEYRVKNTQRLLQYFSYTFWYQSFTGLIQITLLSWFTFEVIVNTNFAYLTWILLLGLQKQYPGCLGIFRGLLEGLQHYDKVEIIGLIQGQIVDKVTTIWAVVAFRMWGEGNLSYGVMMAVIIGHIIGSYVDDVIFEFIAVYFLKKILRKYFGLGLRDLFEIRYDKAVLRDILFYGLQGSVLPFVGAFVETYRFFTYVGNINAFAYWSSIIGMGMGLAGQMGQFGDFALSTAIAEAYMSGKKKLSEFYISYSLRWRMFFMVMLGMIIFGMMPFYFVAIQELAAYQYYQGIEIFIIPAIIAKLLWVFVAIPDSIMWGARHITAHNIIRVVEEFGKMFFVWYFVIYLRIQETWGLVGLTYLIGFTDWVPIFIKTAVCYIYVRLRILKIKIYVIPTFVIPFISALPAVVLAQTVYYTIFWPTVDVLGLLPTLVLCIAVYFIFIVYTYFPMNAILGGLDDYQLFTFAKAVDLSGPSKFMFKGVLKLMNGSVKIARKLKLHGRFPIPYKEAHKEIRELLEIKRKELQNNLARTGIKK
ncbi:MAG: hypothetical protein ACFFCS_22880 [Candidatus Hodarchaeota archaeon]